MMQARRFNFVKRKSAGVRFDFVSRETRVTAAPALPRGIVAAARGLLLSAAVLAVFIFSANLLVRYFFENADIKAPSLDILSFSKPKYFISKGNMFVVYGNGRSEIVNRNMDGVSLPYLTGVDADEKNREKKKALEMALALSPAYLKDIAEVNLSSPQNIVLITMDGKKVFAGDSLSNEKMDNLYTALDRMTGRYSTVDLRFKDRVIFR